ncbi:140_t:CDS:2 [Paraglomus brasilianum]|uniref:140_t:CDS:1 n=1 Tax=Paraglomus brasilianum TaxID=144538 RepID=A0A9N9GNI7_9GLOM|nr:140_t:CDS:2 [Paraglomus brasilianum]
MSSHRRKSKRQRSNTSPVNRDNQDQEKRSRVLAQIKALESEIAELQTEIDERRKKRARSNSMDEAFDMKFLLTYSQMCGSQRVPLETIRKRSQLYSTNPPPQQALPSSSFAGQSETSLSYLPYGMYSNNVPILNNDEGFVLPLHKEIRRLIRQWGNTGAGEIDDDQPMICHRDCCVARLRAGLLKDYLIKPDQYQASPDTHAMSDSFNDATDFSESTPRTHPCPYHPSPSHHLQLRPLAFLILAPNHVKFSNWTLETPPVRVGRQVDRPLEANAVSSWSMDNLTNNNPVRTIEQRLETKQIGIEPYRLVLRIC